MLKRLLLSGAALAALTTFASAQMSAPADPATPPAATAPASPGAVDPAATAEVKTDPNLFSNIKGADVVGEGDESVGSVADLLIDADGSLKALVISHGGLVGIGKTYRTYDVTEVPQVADGKLTLAQLNTAALEGLPQYEYPEAETGRASTGAPADGTAEPAPAPQASGSELWPVSSIVGATVGAAEDKASISDVRFEGGKLAAALIDRGSLGLGNKVEEVAFEELTISGTPAEPQIALSSAGGAATPESSTVPGGESSAPMAPPAAPAPAAP